MPEVKEPSEVTPLAPQDVEKHSLWTRERIIIVGFNSYNVFMWSVYYTVMVPLLPMYARQYGFDEFGQGIVLASLQIGWFLGLPFVNKAYTKPRTMVYIGAVSFTAAPAMVACHPAFWTMCVARVIEGFGTCVLVVLMTSVMVREIPEEIRGFAFGLKGGIAALGFVFGPLAGGVLYPYGGLRLIMIVLTVMSAVGLLLYILLMPDRWFVSYEERLASFEAKGISLFARFSALLRERVLSWLFFMHFIMWFLKGLIWMAVPQFMTQDLALTSAMITIFWLTCEASNLFGSLAGGFLADKMKPWDVFFGGLSLLHVALCVLIAVALQSPLKDWVFLVACSLVFVFGTSEDGILGPAFMKMITMLETRLSETGTKDHTQSNERYEEVLSTMEFLTSVAMTLGPLYAGSAYTAIGFAMTVLGFTIVSCITSICSAWATFELRSMAPSIESKV